MPLEFKKINSEMGRPLARFFRHLNKSRDTQWFHPHPLTSLQAKKICAYRGKDLYYVAMNQDHILAYGMLRGWDEGWKTPSLGIAMHQDVRRKGLAKAFMHFLHAAARAKEAREVRLKVHPENVHAVMLYASIGYRFRKKMEDNQMVGFMNVRAKKIEGNF